MEKQSKNERLIWEVFMNAPAAECLKLLADAQKLLTARNIIKAPRVRKPATKAEAP